MKKNVIALILSVVGLGTAVPSMAQVSTAQEALSTMAKNGLVVVQDLEREYGYWTAQATRKDGVRAYVLLNDKDGKLLTISRAELGKTYPGASQVSKKLKSLGYAHIRELEFDDGFWKAEVRTDRKSPEQELVLHPVSLDIINQVSDVRPGTGKMLTRAQVRQTLQGAGYSQIRDMELDDGIWDVDAINADGYRVDLRVHPETGAVMYEKLEGY